MIGNNHTKNNVDHGTLLWADLDKMAGHSPHGYALDQPLDRRRSGWIIAFTDLMALMLSFFILIFSMSAPSEGEWGIVSASLTAQFKKLDDQLQGFEGPSNAANIPVINNAEGDKLSYIQTLLENGFKDMASVRDGDVIVQAAPDRVVVFAPRLLRFQSETAALDGEEAAAPFIGRLADMLAGLDNRVMLVGHAHEREMQGVNNTADQQYPQILAFNRALTLSRELQRYGYDEAPVILGMGDGREDMLQGAFNDIQKDILMRRVDIVILREQAK